MRKLLSWLVIASALFACPAIAAYPVSVTIANGASLSGAADLTAFADQGYPKPIALLMPAAWTSAAITVQASEDGSTFYNVFVQGGTEYTLTTPLASQYIILTPGDLRGANYIKIRSGTSGSPVNQGAARTIQILLQ